MLTQSSLQQVPFAERLRQLGEALEQAQVGLRLSLYRLQAVGCPKNDTFYVRLTQALHAIRDFGYIAGGPGGQQGGQPEAGTSAAGGSKNSQPVPPPRRGSEHFSEEDLDKFSRPAEEWCMSCLRAFASVDAPCMNQEGAKATSCRHCAQRSAQCQRVSDSCFNLNCLSRLY